MIFYILQISATTKTCGSSDLRKLIPAQKPATCNLPKFPADRLKNQPNWAGKPPTWHRWRQISEAGDKFP